MKKVCRLCPQNAVCLVDGDENRTQAIPFPSILKKGETAVLQCIPVPGTFREERPAVAFQVPYAWALELREAEQQRRWEAMPAW